MATYKTLTTEPGRTIQVINATEWTYVRMQLNSAGPVVMGNVPELGPISAGRGVQVTATPLYTIVRPGENVYVFSDAFNEVSVIFETLPFLVGNTMALLDGIAKVASFITGKPVQSPGKKC